MSTTHDGGQTDRTQTVRSAWTNALRAEVLRIGSRDLAAVARVGVWLATYADADGSNAWPSRETLAVLAGCTPESVTRALRVLEGVGVLAKRRRPNSTAVYRLLIGAERPDWGRHMHHYTDTRQRKARAAQKAALADGLTRKASPDAVRTASPQGVPDSVPGLGSGQRPRTPSGGSDSVPGHPRTASPDAVRTASPAGGYQYLPTYGRDQPPYHPAREADDRLPALPGAADEGGASIRPLVEAMHARGMDVSWPLDTNERRQLAAQVAAIGVHALVEHAARVWRGAKNTPYSVRLFLPQWLALQPAPAGPPTGAAALGGPSPTADYLSSMAALASEWRQGGPAWTAT
ncbi:helix-turn-helix domain-containing protein [Kitasatospora sp. NPDC003701]